MKTENYLFACLLSMFFVNLAYGYPPLAPYSYCAANPVNVVDPDGRDIWEINQHGEIVNRIKDRTQDGFYMVEKNTDGIWQRREGQSLVFDYGTISASRRVMVTALCHGSSKSQRLTFFEVKGDDNAAQLFEFLANFGVTTNVEWGHVKVGFPNSGRNMVGTLHEPAGSGMNDYAFTTGYTIRESNHNHPSGISGPSKEDVNHAIAVQIKFPDARFNIYTSNPPIYSPYDKSTPFESNKSVF